jgi:4-diphosphocytidyl-2C-methyl-D-erythritol kinase
MLLGNTFEAALGHRRREFESLQRRLREAGASSVSLTGSGSAVVGVLPRGARPTAAVRRFEGDEALYLVRSMGRGLTFMTRS